MSIKFKRELLFLLSGLALSGNAHLPSLVALEEAYHRGNWLQALAEFREDIKNEPVESVNIWYDNAVEIGQREPLIILMLLLTHGEVIQIKNIFNPLHVAARQNNYGEIYRLSRMGALVDSVNPFGSTPLHVAALNGNNLAAQALLNQGANVNSTDVFGFTPLFYAVLKNDYLICHTLMGSAAYPTADVINLAQSLGDPNVLSLVSANGTVFQDSASASQGFQHSFWFGSATSASPE